MRHPKGSDLDRPKHWSSPAFPTRFARTSREAAVSLRPRPSLAESMVLGPPGAAAPQRPGLRLAQAAPKLRGMRRRYRPGRAGRCATAVSDRSGRRARSPAAPPWLRSAMAAGDVRQVSRNVTSGGAKLADAGTAAFAGARTDPAARRGHDHVARYRCVRGRAYPILCASPATLLDRVAFHAAARGRPSDVLQPKASVVNAFMGNSRAKPAGAPRPGRIRKSSEVFEDGCGGPGGRRAMSFTGQGARRA
jgi:hypothetical protein